MVLVPDVVPIVIVVVPFAAPPVPMLIALVAAATAPVPMLRVEAPVTVVLKFKVATADAVSVVAFERLTVAFAIVAVPVAAPSAKVVAAPKALTVVTFVLNSVKVPVVEAAIVGALPFMLMFVAFVNVAVVLPTVNVPVAAPIAIVVAAPNAFTVVTFVLNNVNVPVVDAAMVGALPFILMFVALVNVAVVLPTVKVPVDAPIAIVVAAPKALTVVTFVLNNVNVPVVDAAIVGALPLILTFVAFVNVAVVLPTVKVPVDAPIAIVVAAPKALTVVLLVLNNVTVPVVDAWITGALPLMFTTVAFANVAVVFLMVAVPVVAPKVNAVAAPKAFTVATFVLNSVNVPVVEAAMVGSLPLMFTFVAFVSVAVVLPNVNVPVAAPMEIVVAAPNALTVVLLVLNNVTVPVVDA
jgi:hypothetical protein